MQEMCKAVVLIFVWFWDNATLLIRIDVKTMVIVDGLFTNLCACVIFWRENSAHAYEREFLTRGKELSLSVVVAENIQSTTIQEKGSNVFPFIFISHLSIKISDLYYSYNYIFLINHLLYFFLFIR